MDLVDQRVARMFREWMADRLIGLTEETRAIVKRIEFEGKAQSLNCVALWQQMEDVAQQYG